MRKLIDDQNNHEQRPLWQTDLAEMLLLEKLAGLHQNAAEFCEFGVPTEDQKRAFSAVAAEAVELLTDAELRFFQLQNELPRESDHEAKRVATGLWDRMMNQYYGTRPRPTCSAGPRTSPASSTTTSPITKTWGKTPRSRVNDATQKTNAPGFLASR